MMKYALLIAILAATGCTTTSARMVIDGKCTVNERAKLSGLKAGASLVTPNAETQRQIDELEAECHG